MKISMNILGAKNVSLIREALNVCGRNTDAYYYIEERLLVSDLEIIHGLVVYIVGDLVEAEWDDFSVKDAYYETAFGEFRKYVKEFSNMTEMEYDLIEKVEEQTHCSRSVLRTKIDGDWKELSEATSSNVVDDCS